MTTRISAWKARDGSIHETEEAARRADARAALRAIESASIGDYEIGAILDNAEAVHAALTEYLARHQKRVQSLDRDDLKALGVLDVL